MWDWVYELSTQSRNLPSAHYVIYGDGRIVSADQIPPYISGEELMSGKHYTHEQVHGVDIFEEKKTEGGFDSKMKKLEESAIYGKSEPTEETTLLPTFDEIMNSDSEKVAVTNDAFDRAFGALQTLNVGGEYPAAEFVIPPTLNVNLEASLSGKAPVYLPVGSSGKEVLIGEAEFEGTTAKIRITPGTPFADFLKRGDLGGISVAE